MTDIDPVIREEIERQEADQDAAEFIADVLSKRLTFADLAKPLGPIQWVIPALKICPGAPTMVAGYGYSGKTLALQSLELAVATGRDVWGVYKPNEGRVLHVDYEQGRDLCIERYQALARGMGIDLVDELERDQFSLLCRPELYLDHYKARDRWARLSEGFKLVVIDSLRAAAPSADELSSDIRKPLDALGAASEVTGATFVIIHHANKAGANAQRRPGEEPAEAKYSLRGNSAVFDGLGGCFVFEAKKGEPTKIHHEKQRRRGNELATFGLRYVDIEPPDGVEDWHGKGEGLAYGVRVEHLEPEQLAQREQEKRQDANQRLDARVLEAIAQGKASSSNTLIRALGGRRQAMLDAIRDLVDRGKLVRKGQTLSLPNGSAHSDHQFPLVPVVDPEPAGTRERGGGSLP